MQTIANKIILRLFISKIHDSEIDIDDIYV